MPSPPSWGSRKRPPRSASTAPGASCGKSSSRPGARRKPMRSDTLVCGDVSEALAGIADGSRVAPLGVIRHVDTCLRCQAELAQYRKLLRALHQLRTEVLEPAPGLLTDILTAVEAAGEKRAVRSLVRGHRGAYLGGIAAATAAAGAAGALVLASRARQRRVRLAG